MVIRNLSWLLEKRWIIFFYSVQLRTKNSKGFFNITDHQGFIAGIVLPCSMHIRIAIQELALAIRPIKLCCSSSEHFLKVFMKQWNITLHQITKLLCGIMYWDSSRHDSSPLSHIYYVTIIVYVCIVLLMTSEKVSKPTGCCTVINFIVLYNIKCLGTIIKFHN